MCIYEARVYCNYPESRQVLWDRHHFTVFPTLQNKPKKKKNKSKKQKTQKTPEKSNQNKTKQNKTKKQILSLFKYIWVLLSYVALCRLGIFCDAMQNYVNLVHHIWSPVSFSFYFFFLLKVHKTQNKQVGNILFIYLLSFWWDMYPNIVLYNGSYHVTSGISEE